LILLIFGQCISSFMYTTVSYEKWWHDK